MGRLELMIHVSKALDAKQICEVDTLTPAASYGLFGTGGVSKNPLYGAATVEVNPYLTSSTRWYLIARGGVMKPLMFMMRRPLELDQQGPGSAIYFEEEKVRFGGSARYEVSYTLPQLALTSIG